MAITRITGGMLRAARSLAGLSQQEVADRACVSRPSVTAWEGPSGSIPSVNTRALDRVVAALEAEGIEFSPNGVRLERSAPTSTVIHSEGAAAGATP